MEISFDADRFYVGLQDLEDILIAIKLRLVWFYDQFSTSVLQAAVRVLIEQLPSGATKKLLRNEDTLNGKQLEALELEKLKTKYTSQTPLLKTPLASNTYDGNKYSITRSGFRASSLKCAKVVIHVPKNVAPIEPVDTGGQRLTQYYIASIKRLIAVMMDHVDLLRVITKHHKTPLPDSDKSDVISDLGVICQHLRKTSILLIRCIAQLNSRRHVERILLKLKNRSTVKLLLGKIDAEKKKKKQWKN
ncbi:unnamed protein product [Schistocephalus solidus]|uniref:POLAc domain-containing protein n=1 Tax=Schistocephalus solidus TaxID=70667 RepID=A0A183SJD8_SCHSO|nr:unnamed protein product [Schistocephalus solidus]